MSDQPNISSHYRNPDEPRSRWGFIVYRTSYGDDALWERVKQKLEQARLASYAIIQDQWSLACAERSTLVYIEDEARLSGKTYVDVRLLFNPRWPNDRDEVREDDLSASLLPLPGMPQDFGDLCKVACLIIDHESMVSIDRGPSPPRLFAGLSWVWAVDCSEDYTRDNPPWDGTFKVDICAIWGDLYMRSLHWSADLTMNEVRPGRGKVFTGDDCSWD